MAPRPPQDRRSAVNVASQVLAGGTKTGTAPSTPSTAAHSDREPEEEVPAPEQSPRREVVRAVQPKPIPPHETSLRRGARSSPWDAAEPEVLLVKRHPEETVCEVLGGRELPNKSHFFVQQAAPTGPRRQPYCPKIYGEDARSPEAPQAPQAPQAPDSRAAAAPDAATDKVAQMRSRILSIKELRAQSDGDSPPQEATSMAPVQSSSEPPSSFPQPQERLAAIMNFLDEVEESSKADISSLVASTRSSRSAGDNEDGRCSRVPSGLAQDAAAVHSRSSMLEVEVRDKKQIIESLKRALQESQEREKEKEQATAKEWEEKLQQQKAHYEGGVERHLKLVDRLLNDKTELTRRCELFSDELKAVERKYQMKIEEMEDHAAKELAKNKQNWIATERLKREAWEKEKVKEIKDMTVKGLQPEVEKILAERKQEKLRMEECQREALEEQRRELLGQAQKQLQDLREQKHREMEAALDREREGHRQKLRDEFERFNRELQEERTKCAADLLAERRLREELLRQGAESSETKLREALAAERARHQESLHEAEAKLAEAGRKHAEQLASLEGRLRAEADQSQKAALEQSRVHMEEREASLRKELAAERDRQLEILMDRLSREHVERQLAFEAEASSKVQEARAAAGEDLARLAKQLEDAKAEVRSAQQQKSQLDEVLRSLKDTHSATADQLAKCQKQSADLESDRNDLRKEANEVLEKHRRELRELDKKREQEIEDLREELGAAKVRVHEEQAKLEDLRKESKLREEQIIMDLEARVKRTLQAKDETISELRRRNTALDNKVSEFGYLLERQREELLGGLVGERQR